MTATALIVAFLGCSIGLGLSRFWVRQGPSPDLLNLEERLIHARNLGMRLSELAENQSRLSAESKQLEHHLSLKEGVSWMLTQVHQEMDRCQHASTDDALDRMEGLLSATCKSLRCLLEVGSSPVMSLRDLQPATRAVHKSLSLLVHQQSGLASFLDEGKNNDYQIDSIAYINDLINTAKNHNLPAHIVIEASQDGVSMACSQGHELSFLPWLRVQI